MVVYTSCLYSDYPGPHGLPTYYEALETPELWGPTSTTKYMLLDNTVPKDAEQARLGVPHMPHHRLNQRLETQVKSQQCERGARPPAGCIDVVVIECLNLAVPHKFQSIWNVQSVSPMVQVELVERGRNGAEMIQYLKTTTMSRSKTEIFKRSPVDPVYNETCRFAVPHLNPSAIDVVARSNVLVSVVDADSGKCLGSVTVPISEVLQKRAAPFYTWYELMKPGPGGDVLVPITGGDPTKLSCIHLGFWCNPAWEQDTGDFTLGFDAQRYKLDYQTRRLADENLRLAEEYAVLHREEERLASIRLAQQHRARSLRLEEEELRSRNLDSRSAASSSIFTMPTLPSLPAMEMPSFLPSLPTFTMPTWEMPKMESPAMPNFSSTTGTFADAASESDAARDTPADAIPREPQAVPIVPVSSMQQVHPVAHGSLEVPLQADEAALPDSSHFNRVVVDAVEEVVAEDEEALRPWMHIKDVEEVLLQPQKFSDSKRRRWTLDVVPGALGVLQGMAAEGYEIVVTCKASRAQAAQSLEVLRMVEIPKSQP